MASSIPTCRSSNSAGACAAQGGCYKPCSASVGVGRPPEGWRRRKAVLGAKPDETRPPQDAAAPIRTFGFTLTRADWAAYENLPAEARGWRKWIVFIFAALAGAGWSSIEESFFPDGPGEATRWLGCLAVIAAAYGLATLALTLDRRRKIARRPVPAGETLVAGGTDSLWTRNGGASRLHGMNDLQWPIYTTDHIFLQAPRDEAVILPRRAFADADDMRSFALWLEQRMEALDALRETNDVESSP